MCIECKNKIWPHLAWHGPKPPLTAGDIFRILTAFQSPFRAPCDLDHSFPLQSRTELSWLCLCLNCPGSAPTLPWPWSFLYPDHLRPRKWAWTVSLLCLAFAAACPDPVLALLAELCRSAKNSLSLTSLTLLGLALPWPHPCMTHASAVFLALFQHRTWLWLGAASVLWDEKFIVTGPAQDPKSGPAGFLPVPNWDYPAMPGSGMVITGINIGCWASCGDWGYWPTMFHAGPCRSFGSAVPASRALASGEFSSSPTAHAPALCPNAMLGSNFNLTLVGSAWPALYCSWS